MTGALEMTCVFVMHYGQKMHFLSKKLLFGRFIGRKVYFETIVPVKKLSHLMVWDKFPFNFQKFERVVMVFLKYKNGPNLEELLSSTF